MKKQINPSIKAQILRSAFYLLLLVAVSAIPFALAQPRSRGTAKRSVAASAIRADRTLTFADRFAYQHAIEDVYWRHRIWPEENAQPKPSLEEVVSAAQIEKKVEDYLRDSQALETYWQKPIAPEQLQAEIERMARDTKQPEVLRELFEALGNDPFVIAECLARPVLTERLVAELSANDKAQRFVLLRTQAVGSEFSITTLGTATYVLPEVSNPDGCTDDSWTATSTTNAPGVRDLQTAVWTGSEMIVWGGNVNGTHFNTGGRYNPSTNTWTATSTTNAPAARFSHTAIWTGSEMIVWGGVIENPNPPFVTNTGGRYNPSTDTWTVTSTTNVPTARSLPTAVWTGSEMIVWGGFGHGYYNSGGRYNPSTDSWIATSRTKAPLVFNHTAVWTGSEMVIWGRNYAGSTGGRYNPETDSWAVTGAVNAPTAREGHTAIWTGSEMIVWGGSRTSDYHYLKSGGRYDPVNDSWTATSTANAPTARYRHTAVWTGTEMIVWGGYGITRLNTGGRYCAPGLPAQLGNISTRAFVQTSDNVVIGGFIVQGSAPKKVIIRAIGPELGGPPYNVPGALADPTLELHDATGALIASNDNWHETIIGGIITGQQWVDILNSGHVPGDPRESAIIAELPTGNYTAIVRGVNNTTGVALVEAYDLSPGTDSILGNISTRSFVQTGDNVMIGGFILQGRAPKKVIIRAIGPELGGPPYNVPGALADPTLELHDATGALIASNDNWHQTIIGGIITSQQWVDILNSGYAPADGRESAIIADLPAGIYTAILRGVNNTTGVALVEVYDLGE